MMIDLSKIELSQDDLDTIHDVLFNALDLDILSNDEIISYWNKLPDDIKIEALKWGVSDTLVRARMYIWFETTCK